MLLEKGKDNGLKPIGLGARNTLRLEASFLLYGDDINKSTTPLEAGIGWTVKFNKEEDFIGNDSLSTQRKDGLKRKLIAFKMIDKGIPRTGSEILLNNNAIGTVTSGTFSPTLGIGIGLGYIAKYYAEPNIHIDIRIRGAVYPANIVKTPFVTKI